VFKERYISSHKVSLNLNIKAGSTQPLLFLLDRCALGLGDGLPAHGCAAAAVQGRAGAGGHVDGPGGDVRVRSLVHRLQPRRDKTREKAETTIHKLKHTINKYINRKVWMVRYSTVVVP
jgi:hypothetical protein